MSSRDGPRGWIAESRAGLNGLNKLLVKITALDLLTLTTYICETINFGLKLAISDTMVQSKGGPLTVFLVREIPRNILRILQNSRE